MAARTVQQLLDEIAAQTHVYNLPTNFQRSNANVHTISGNQSTSGSGGGGGFHIPHPNFHSVLDLLSRTSHASAGYASDIVSDVQQGNWSDLLKKEILQTISPVGGAASSKGFREGLTGKAHKRYQDVIKQVGYSGPGAGTAGFVGDVLLDPLTYVGGAGVATKLAKGGEIAADASKLAKAGNAAKNTGKFYAEVTGVAPLGRGVTKAAVATGSKVTKITTKGGKALEYAKDPGVNKAHLALQKLLEDNPKVKPIGEIKARLGETDVKIPAVGVQDVKPARNIGEIHATEAQKANSAVSDKQLADAVVKKHPVLKTAENLTPADKTVIFARTHELMNNKFKKLSTPTLQLKLKRAGVKPAEGTFVQWSDIPDKIKSQVLRQNEALGKEWKNLVSRATESHVNEINKGIKQTVKTKQVEEAATAISDGKVIEPAGPAEARAAETFAKLKTADLPIVAEVLEHAQEAIKANKNNGGFLSATDQVNLRNAIGARVVKAMAEAKKQTAVNPRSLKVQNRIDAIYNHVEAALEHGGFKPAVVGKEFISPIDKSIVYEDRTPLRLSTILPHISAKEKVDGQYLTQILMGKAVDPRVKAVYQAAYAGAHIEDASKLQPVLQQISEAYAAVANSGDLGAMADYAEHATNAAVDAAKATGASPVGVETVKNIIKSDIEDLKNSDPIVGESIRIVTSGEADRVANGTLKASGPSYQLADAISRSLGIRVLGPDNYIKLYNSGKAAERVKKALNLTRDADTGLLTAAQDAHLGIIARTVETSGNWLSKAFDTGIGFHDVAPIKRAATNEGIAHTHDVLMMLSDQLRDVSAADSRLAFRMAQTGDFTGPDELVKQAKFIKSRMERMFGHSGVLRTNLILPEEHQSMITRAFYADRHGAKPAFILKSEHTNSVAGATHKLDNPYDSWRYWNLPSDGKYEHAGRVLFSLEDAMHKSLMVRKAEDSAAVMLGGASEAFRGSEQIGRYHYPAETAPQMKNMLNSMVIPGPKSNEFWRSYDKALNTYKRGFTQWLPSHHINNSIGQFMIAFVDGLTNPNWYRKSAQVLKGRDKSIDPFGTLSASSDAKVIMHYRGQPLTANQIWELGTQAGIRQGHASSEDAFGAEEKLMRSLSSKVQSFADTRENFHRFGHFMYALNEEQKSGRTLEEAAMRAGQRVNASHADYNDLTRIERTVFRRLIPFYTWQRKVGPMIFKQMMTNPGRTMVYPKALAQIAINNGADPNDPFPNVNGLVPSYMTNLMQIPLGQTSNGNQLYGGPRTPFSDVVGQYTNHPMGTILNSLTPAIKLPAELGSTDDQGVGHSLGSGIPFYNGKLSHTEDALPYISLLKRLMRRDPAHGFAPTKNPDNNPDQQGVNLTALMNLLTGSNMQENTQAAQRYAKKEVAKK